MPLEQRVIAPIFVSRGCFTLDAHHPNGQITSSVNIPNELECVTNGTLANIIRQLSSLSRYAEDLFGSILEETSTLVQRSVSLKSRLDVLSERVERLDASSDSASLQSASSAGANLSKKPFRSRADNFDQQVVARGTIPLSLREVYEGCDEPPPLEKLNPFRDDNINGLKLYTNPNYFFELWRKEMLADRSRNKVAKKGETAHNSAKSKRNKASVLRHQTSINSDSTASPAHYQQHQQQQQVHQQAGQHAHYHPASVAYGGSLSSNEYPPTYSETGTPTYGHLAAAAHQQQQAQQQAYAQQQAQQKIYGQTGPNGPVYGYMGGPGGDVVSVKREEPNASGVGTYTVIEGYSVDPNNYQHHYVQYAGGQQGPPGSASNRPNSLELSHQQQYGTYGTTGGTGGQPMPPPMEQYHGYTQQQQQQQQQQYQRSQGPYGQTGVQQQSIYGQTTGGPQQQQQPSQYSPGSAANTPTRRAGASRPSAPPPAPPSNPNSAPSTPKKVNGVFDMSVVSGHSPLVSRDSLPPPPPPPPGHANGGGGGPGGLHHLNSQDSIDSVLPPPPPPPPLPGAAGMVNGTSAAFSPPPPPPPPPMNLNGLSMHSSSSATTNTTTSRQTTSAMPTSVSNSNSVCPNPTAEMLKNQAVKLRPTQANNHRDSGPVSNSSTLDPHSNLMAAIRDGFKLKKVEESAAKEKERTVPLHDVASILARRVAMELSDSEAENEDADEDSDAWDDESEC